MKRIADEFRRLEYYHWLNRATSKLFDNLHALVDKIKTESDEAKLFENNIYLEKMMESKEMAEIINGLLEKMNLDKTIKEWIDHWKKTGGYDNEEEEEKEEEKKLEDEKKKDIIWKSNEVKKDAEEEKKLHDGKKENIKGKKVKEEEKNFEEELREWKIKIRLEVSRVLLAYEKMNESINFDKYLATDEAKNIEYVPLLERTSNINFVRSADQLPDPRKINELIFALVVKVKEGKFIDIGRNSMNKRNF